MIAAETKFTHMVRARRKVRNGNAGVVSAPAAHELRAVKGIYSAQECGLPQLPVNPTCFESGDIGTRQLLAYKIRRKRLVLKHTIDSRSWMSPALPVSMIRRHS
jgi:hypothetical protein